MKVRTSVRTGALTVESPGDNDEFCLGDTIEIKGTWASPKPTKIWGKLYQATAMPIPFKWNPFQPEAGGPAEGSLDCDGNPATMDWCFASETASQVGDGFFVVWHIDPDSCQIIPTPVQFKIVDCGSGSGSGSGSGMYGMYGTGGPTSAFSVIGQNAPKRYRVQFDAQSLKLPEPAASLLSAGAIQFPAVVLEYQPVLSDQERAIWLSTTGSVPGAWKLEVSGNQTKGRKAELILQRPTATQVLTPFVWTAPAWDFFKPTALQPASGLKGLTLPAAEAAVVV